MEYAANNYIIKDVWLTVCVQRNLFFSWRSHYVHTLFLFFWGWTSFLHSEVTTPGLIITKVHGHPVLQEGINKVERLLMANLKRSRKGDWRNYKVYTQWNFTMMYWMQNVHVMWHEINSMRFLCFVKVILYTGVYQQRQ